MVWKPKKREPTPEELLAKAVETATPYWWNSEPLFVSYLHHEKVHFLPYQSNSFSPTVHPCLLMFLDPSDFDGRQCIELLRELEDRYTSSNIQLIVVLTLSYRSHFNDTFIRALIKKLKLDFPVTIDFQGHFQQLFNPIAPDSMLIDQGKLRFRVRAADFYQKLELTLQSFIAEKSPGTPFFPVYQVPAEIPRSNPGVPRLEFGTALAEVSKTEFSLPGFNVSSGDLRMGIFPGGWQGMKDPAHFISLEGAWSQNQERIMLNSGTGKMSIRTRCKYIAIVAETISTKPIDYNYRSDPEILYTECALQMNGVHPSYDFLAEEVNIFYDGRAVLSIGPIQLYSLFSNLEPEEQELTFTFNVPEHALVAIYGIRFGV